MIKEENPDTLKRIHEVLDELCEKVIILKACPSTITEKQLVELQTYGQQCPPHLFAAPNIINKLRHLLNTKCSNKMPMNKKLNSVLHITVAVIISKLLMQCSHWPVWIVISYLNDSLSSKLWVDNDATLKLCSNIKLAFDDNEYDSMETDEILNDDEIIQDLIDPNIIMNRYKRIKVKVKNVISETVEKYLSNGNCSTYVLQTCLNLIKIQEIRPIISKHLDTWIKNPAMSEQCRILAKNLIKNVKIHPDGSVPNSDIVVLDAVIKLKQTMVNQMDMYKMMLKAAVKRSDIVALQVFKSLIFADVGLSNITETIKLICLLLKEIQASPYELLGRSLGEASSEYFMTHGKFTAQSSKIFIDASSKLLRQCYSEMFSILDFGRGFLLGLGSAISNATVSESTQEFFAFSIDILVMLQFIRFNDSIVESRDSSTRSNTANITKSNFVNIKDLSKSTTTSTKGSTLLKLSSQVKLGNTTEAVPKAKVVTSISDCDRILIIRDVMSIQELAISWLGQISSKLHLTSLNADVLIELVQRAFCLVTSPRVSIEVDKKTNYLIKEIGCINGNIIKAISVLALSTSLSLVTMASWLETIETVVHRVIKTQQTFTCDVILDDIEDVILSLFSLCTLDIISSDIKPKPIEPLIDICLVTSSIDRDVTNHPYKGYIDHKGKRHLIPLPLLVDKSTYWRVCYISYLLACIRPDTVGKFVWENIPTVRDMMVMTISGRYENLGSAKSIKYTKTCLRERLKKFESKLGDEIIITDSYLELSKTSSTQCHHEDLLREFEFAVWKHLFDENVVDNIVDIKEIRRKKDYERWEMEQEKQELKARRDSQQDSRSVRAALRMAKKEGLPVDIPSIELGIKRKLEPDIALCVNFVEVFPPIALSSRTDPYITQYGLPTQDSVMFMNVKDCPRVLSEDITKAMMNSDAKFKLGVKLRSCIDPDFISRTLVDCDEQSMSRDTMWLIPAISEDLDLVLQRLPFQALCHLLRMVTVKVHDRFHSNIWDFNQVDNQDESTFPFFGSVISKHDDLFTSDDNTTDMKLIAALVFKLQVLFTDYNTNQKSERNTVLSIIMSSFEHENFNRRSVCRLFLGYFFKVNSKSSSVTYSFDDVTRLGPICCDFMSALKTMYISLNKHNDSDATIIIDSVTNCFKSEGNIKVIRTMLQFLKWLETEYNHSMLSTKALLLLLSTEPLTAKHVLSCMSLDEICLYMQPVISSISTLSNQANNLISQTASTNLVSSPSYESFFIGVRIVHLDFESIFQRKQQQTKIQGNVIAVRVDAVRSLLMIALFHPNSYNHLNSPLIECSLSVLACLTIENIKNFFGDIIGLTRTSTNYKHCKILLSILPTEILLKLMKHYSGFTIEFMKAFTDTIDKTVMIGLLSWEQIVKILGVAAFLKLCKELEPLVKCLRCYSSLDAREEGEEIEELSYLGLSLDDLKNYADSSIVLKQVFEYTASSNIVASAMEIDSVFEKNDCNNEEIELIVASINDYQTLFKQLLKVFKDCDLCTLENNLKCLFVRTLSVESASITIANKITLVEAINAVLVLLKGDDSQTSESPSWVDDLLMKLALTANHFFKYDETTIFLQPHFLDSYLPFKDTASAHRFLERVIDIINENDNNLDGSSLIVIAIEIILSALASSSLIEITSFLPKIAKLLLSIKIPYGVFSWKSIDLPFFDNFTKRTRNLNLESISQLVVLTISSTNSIIITIIIRNVYGIL